MVALKMRLEPGAFCKQWGERPFYMRLFVTSWFLGFITLVLLNKALFCSSVIACEHTKRFEDYAEDMRRLGVSDALKTETQRGFGQTTRSWGAASALL